VRLHPLNAAALLLAWLLLLIGMVTLWPLLALSLILALAVSLFLRHLLRLSKGRPKRSTNQPQPEAETMAQDLNTWKITIQAVLTAREDLTAHDLHDSLFVGCDKQIQNLALEDVEVVRQFDRTETPQTTTLADEMDQLIAMVRIGEKIEKGEA
tara:strand:- start:632 stop:1093 length:462 start_codon:yes stop_codon:yes gene_type:complete